MGTVRRLPGPDPAEFPELDGLSDVEKAQLCVAKIEEADGVMLDALVGMYRAKAESIGFFEHVNEIRDLDNDGGAAYELLALAVRRLAVKTGPESPQYALGFPATEDRGDSPDRATADDLGTRNPRIGLDADGTLDDFLATGAECVHFEAVDQAEWWMSVALNNGEEWHLNFGARSPRAKGYARAERVE